MIRKVLKTLVSFLNAVFRTATSLALVAGFSTSKDRRIAKTARHGEECIILGNGPSLKETLAEHDGALQGKDSVCVNDFADSPFFIKLKPSFYVMTDPVYWARDAADHFRESFRRYNELIRTTVNWPLTLFLPAAARRWNFFMDLPRQNPRVAIHYLNTTEIDCFRRLRFFLYRHGLAIPMMQNVLVAAIYVALQAGYKTIYVIGADHSWHESLYVDEHNRLFLKNDRVQDTEEQHLSPFYINPGHTIPYTMHKLLGDFSRMYAGYEELEAYAKSLGAKIYNASEKSYIDAFERKEFPSS